MNQPWWPGAVPSAPVRRPRSRVVVRTVSWMLAFFALAAAATSWLTPQPDLDADDAVDVALGALAEVGIDGAVAGDVELISHTPEEGDPVEAWSVPIGVDDDEVELRVQESAGALVFVDDRIGSDDAGRLLDDEQYARLERYRDDSVLDAWVLRNAGGTASAVVIAAVSLLIARRSGRLWV